MTFSADQAEMLRELLRKGEEGLEITGQDQLEVAKSLERQRLCNIAVYPAFIVADITAFGAHVAREHL